MGSVLPFGPSGIIRSGAVSPMPPSLFAVPNGLVGYWGFDPDCLDFTQGNAFDLTANRNVGILNGSPTLAAGQVGTALSFNGTSQYVSLPNNIFNSYSVGTIAAWINPSSLPSGVNLFTSIFSNASTTGNTFWLVFGIKTFSLGPTLSYIEINPRSSNNSVYAANSPLVVGQWQHVAVSSNGSTWALYFNGAIQALTIIGGNSGEWFSSEVSGTMNYSIGVLNRQSGAADYFTGLIDDVCVWNRVLYPWEITAKYQAGLQGRRDAGMLVPPAFGSMALGPQSSSGLRQRMLSGVGL